MRRLLAAMPAVGMALLLPTPAVSMGSRRRYRATITATDSAGQKSQPRRVNFRIVNR